MWNVCYGGENSENSEAKIAKNVKIWSENREKVKILKRK
jgi:hypothetical protein